MSMGALSSLNCAVRLSDTHDVVEENRRRVLASLGLGHCCLVVPKLAHGNQTIIVGHHDEDPAEKQRDADAVITASAGVALGITYADCLPILVSAIDQSVIAAIHAGWRGIQNGVIASTITRMREEFATSELVAGVGPAISPTGFVVTDAVLRSFLERWPDFTQGDGDQGTVDLTGICLQQLRNLDVRVDKVGGFTDLDPARYYSHRRDRGNTGRHLAVIVKTA